MTGAAGTDVPGSEPAGLPAAGLPGAAARAHPAGLGFGGRQRCLVMGVVNVTPDSFSDGGSWFETTAAIAHGHDLAAEGADIIDVGGESTRPGALRVGQAEELRRVIPVVTELAGAGLTVSVDTTRAAVAQRALEAGARLVNDVSGGLADSQMARVAADAGAAYVVMHWRGYSRDMQAHAVYTDVVAEVRSELAQRVDAAVAAGVDPSAIIVDPGIGFAKLPRHNWALLTQLEQVARPAGDRRFPLLIGLSRKSFLGSLLAGTDGTPRPARERDEATVALSALAAVAGAWCVRVHAVAANADAVRVAARWQGAGTG